MPLLMYIFLSYLFLIKFSIALQCEVEANTTDMCTCTVAIHSRAVKLDRMSLPVTDEVITASYPVNRI